MTNLLPIFDLKFLLTTYYSDYIGGYILKITKRIISILIIVAVLTTVCVMTTTSFSASGTGTGLASWALKAYNEGWSYVYGGSSAGAVDCSGLIYSYAGGNRGGDDQYYNSSYRGSVSSGIPNIHGLGLFQPGHVGVYVGGGMAVDARGDEYGVCYESAYSHHWTNYFKVPGVSYPSTGWEKFQGEYFYYEDGEYLSDTSKTIDGVTYYFDSDGVSSNAPSSNSSSSESQSSQQSTSNVLKKGSTGAKVEKLQQRLYDLGYYTGLIDGDFGEQTEKAFMLFQKAAGLTPDGIAGSDVDYLYADDAPSYKEVLSISKKDDEEVAQTSEEAEEEKGQEEKEFTVLKNGDFDEKVADVQERLITLEYLEGEADGSFGTATEKAVKTFQGANGITQSGEVDKFTYTVLFSDEAKVNPHHEEATQEVKVQKETQVATRIANTEADLKTNELSQKALSGVTDSLGFSADKNGNNFQFILLLAAMILVMTITFIIVYAREKKKMKRNKHHRFQ